MPSADCDGTLLDSMGIHYEAWKHTAAQFGIKINAAGNTDPAPTPPPTCGCPCQTPEPIAQLQPLGT